MARMSDIECGDRVTVNHKGRIGEGTVTALDRNTRTITIDPDNPRFTWREVPVKEVTDVRSQRWSPASAVFR